MNLPKTSRLLLLGVVLAATAGCNVDERLWWSPDGSRAALRTPAGLCLVTADGNLSAPLASDVIAAAWLPDGKKLAIVRKFEVSKWSDVVRLAPRAETEQAELLAKGMPDLSKALRTITNNDANAIDDKFPVLLKVSRDEWVTPALLCLRDTLPDLLQASLEGFKDADKLRQELTELKAEVFELSLLTLSGNQITGEPLILERTLTQLEQPRPSPAAPAIAYLRGGTLVALPIGGGSNCLTISEKAEGSFDWTPDGKSLAFATRIAEKWDAGSVNLAQIQRRSAIDANGSLTAGDIASLSTIATVHPPRVRCLPDGRVLVASVVSNFPAAADAEQETRLYVIDSAKEPAIPVALPTGPKALPMELAHFAPSPDGKKIALVESGSDVVAVLDVATGAVEVVSPKRDLKCRTLPAWRGAEELYFAALPEPGAKRVEWMRWKSGSAPMVFSRGWADATVDGLLEEAKK